MNFFTALSLPNFEERTQCHGHTSYEAKQPHSLCPWLTLLVRKYVLVQCICLLYLFQLKTLLEDKKYNNFQRSLSRRETTWDSPVNWNTVRLIANQMASWRACETQPLTLHWVEELSSLQHRMTGGSRTHGHQAPRDHWSLQPASKPSNVFI